MRNFHETEIIIVNEEGNSNLQTPDDLGSYKFMLDLNSVCGFFEVLDDPNEELLGLTNVYLDNGHSMIVKIFYKKFKMLIRG